MKKNLSSTSVERIENTIHLIRNQKVILDEDLAGLYGVPTKRLNEQVRRNLDRFPEDFAFRLTKKEWGDLKSQFATSSWGGRRKLPFAFTEHGAYAAAFIIQSSQARMMSVEVVRTFVKIRKMIHFNEKMTKEMNEIKSFLLKHTQKSDQEFRKIWKVVEKLSTPTDSGRRIGFNLE